MTMTLQHRIGYILLSCPRQRSPNRLIAAARHNLPLTVRRLLMENSDPNVREVGLHPRGVGAGVMVEPLPSPSLPPQPAANPPSGVT